MRIIAGRWRGRTIFAPKDDRTRPTIDRVRESLFSTINSVRGGFEGAYVLDAFAGSGALGLEALSRGAESARFCDIDPDAIAVIKRNIEACQASSTEAAVSRSDMLKGIPYPLAQPFNLVFLDPPYATDSTSVALLLNRIEERGLLSPHTLITYEHAKRDDVASVILDKLPDWELVSSKTYGKATIDFFRSGDAAKKEK